MRTAILIAALIMSKEQIPDEACSVAFWVLFTAFIMDLVELAK